MAQELLKLDLLAVRQSIHRVDNDGLDAFAASPTQNMIHDGDDICQAFPRTRAGGEHIIVLRFGSFNGIGLMSV